MSKYYRYWGPTLTGLALFLLWAGIKTFGRLPAWLLPGPAEVWSALVTERTTLARAALDTFLGAAGGFLLAVAAGLMAAIVLALSRPIRVAVYPWVIFMQMMPVVALSAIFVIWLGTGLPSVVLITFVIGVFPIIASTVQGLLSVDRNLLDLFTLYGARRWQEVFLLRVPAAFPYFFTGVQIAATLAVIGAITGELFAGSATGTGGLGFLIVIYKAQLKIPALFATAMVACLLGFLFVGAVSYLKWRCLHLWHESATPLEQ